ncbi:uncharacterized protein LOC130356331 [Hyla sarda]|uniref:uncharacterized protein LOC130356331 n=1 Tax=Hyla sarda TaxID=327740 RepID=UPI0024C3BCA8|nr:uncharacterized protein LOC130356331 [Hyla sarda]
MNSAMVTMHESMSNSMAMTVAQMVAQKSHQSASKRLSKKRHLNTDDLPHDKSKKPFSNFEGQSYDDILLAHSSHDNDAYSMHPRPSTREEQIDIRVKKTSQQQKIYNEVSEYDNNDNDNGDGDDYYDDDDDKSDNSEYNDPSFNIQNTEGEKIDINDPSTSGSDILDELGVPFFNPSQIVHPRSGEWSPNTQLEQFIGFWLNKSLDNRARSKLKAECPRPTISRNATQTPELHPILVRYLLKTGKNPKKGVDRSFKLCQDKVLDLLGPVAKILQISEEAYVSGKPMDTLTVRGWAQRLMCLLGNANQSLSSERRRTVLMKLDPQLAHLANTEPANPTEGLLFGDQNIKEISKYVGLFSGLDKAQSSIKKVYANKVFTRAGKNRCCFSGRNTDYRPQSRGSFIQERPTFTSPVAQPSPFFPYRGRPWRARGQRGFPRSRPAAY